MSTKSWLNPWLTNSSSASYCNIYQTKRSKAGTCVMIHSSLLTLFLANLDFTEIRGFPFLSYILGAQVVWGRDFIWPDFFELPTTSWSLPPLKLYNIAPENRPSQKEMDLPTIHFQVQTVSFREGNLPNFLQPPKKNHTPTVIQKNPFTASHSCHPPKRCNQGETPPDKKRCTNIGSKMLQWIWILGKLSYIWGFWGYNS